MRHSSRLFLSFVLFAISTTMADGGEIRSSVSWMCSTENAPWVNMASINPKKASAAHSSSRVIEIDANKPLQTIRGWGGCFNEKGWEALSVLSDHERRDVLRALFDPTDGAGFNLCRMPLGESDYSLDNAWYSYDETPGDFKMEHFSIERDRKALIPYIKEAMEFQPDLKIWASPWSPPRWMLDVVDGKRVYLKNDPETLRAYGLYYTKFVQAYQAEGIHLFAVMPQNEPCWDTWKPHGPMLCGYPKDRWHQWVKQLVSSFEEHHVPCQIWLGTLPTEGHNPGVVITKKDHVDPILQDTNIASHIAGVGIQYGKDLIKKVHEAYPRVELMQTETYCGKAVNDWAYGAGQFTLIATYLDDGAGAYMLWNMVLDQTGASNEGWKQSAPITVNTITKKVTYNPQFYIYKHFSHFINRGARYLSTSPDDHYSAAFVNPDQKRVVVVLNPTKQHNSTVIRDGHYSFTADLPPLSCNTFTWRPQ